MMLAKPPLTWRDKLLWRLFRIERKRKETLQRFTVMATTDDDTHPCNG